MYIYIGYIGHHATPPHPIYRIYIYIYIYIYIGKYSGTDIVKVYRKQHKLINQYIQKYIHTCITI